MISRIILIVLIFSSYSFSLPKRDLKNLGVNYALSFLSQSATKILRGENVGEALASSLYQSAPVALCWHGGMKLTASKKPLLGQILLQKGNNFWSNGVVKSSPLFEGWLSKWEADYLFFNLRYWSAERKFSARVNLGTCLASVISLTKGENHQLEVRQSIRTGTVVFTADLSSLNRRGIETGRVIVLDGERKALNTQVHESLHSAQDSRGSVITDIWLNDMLGKYIRVNYGHIVNYSLEEIAEKEVENYLNQE